MQEILLKMQVFFSKFEHTSHYSSTFSSKIVTSR